MFTVCSGGTSENGVFTGIKYFIGDTYPNGQVKRQVSKYYDTTEEAQEALDTNNFEK